MSLGRDRDPDRSGRARGAIMAGMTDDAPRIDYGRFEAITFDCYGTLIDWEAGLTAAFQPVFRARGTAFDQDAVLERFAVHEEATEAGPYRRYRDVLAIALRGVSVDFGIEPTADEIDAFSSSVGDWPAFTDTPAALARLRERFRLGIITNCDDDLFAASLPKLGTDFEWVITAQQVGSYKPDERNFEAAFARIGLPRDRILHTAQSLFHDHAPAQRLGMTSVWIDRRGDRAGSGATPHSEAAPDATFPDMASFAAAATS
jgi:2-haloacid dehalogenase